MAQNALDEFRTLIGTADKLRDYKNVDTALEETNLRLKSAQSDLNDARRELAKVKGEADTIKATNAQALTDHKTKLESEAAKAQQQHQQKLDEMKANAHAAVGALDAQLTAKQKELEAVKKEWRSLEGKLAGIEAALQDALTTLQKSTG